VTHNIRDFLYAIQMGETIPEDHVYNLIELEDGSGLIWDGEKRFARVITPGELEFYKGAGHLQEFDGTSPSAAYDAISSTLPKWDRDDPDKDPVELIGRLADVNDVMDAIIAEGRRRRA
jgi:hypothetical protein